jgi:peptide/nickel transport system ATP-binding protein
MPDSVLEARGLGIVVSATGDDIVRDVDLAIAPGEVVGLVGESGAGKTAVGLALLGHARPGSEIVAGEVRFGELDLLAASPAVVRDVLGRRIAFVPQNPGAALNPSMRIGAHLEEVLELHDEDRGRRGARVSELLESVALPGDEAFRRRYPHELSGGQQQRVTIALALACRPAVIVLDEPTTGLDVTTQAQVIDLIDSLRREYGTALLYVSHNLAVVAGIADRVAVMYGGLVIECGPKDEIFGAPRHPYTRMLIGAVPSLDGDRRALVGIPGSAPRPGDRGPGCPFAQRCPHAEPRCESEQTLETAGPEHEVRCVRWRELAERAGSVLGAEIDERPPDGRDRLLEVHELTATYPQRRGSVVTAVQEISFDLRRGECLAVVGESGSGKSTLARCIAGLHRDWTGTIELGGVALGHQAHDRSRELRRRIQIVFQNPDRSLNPQQTVASIIERPARLLRGMGEAEARERGLELLEQVKLSPRYAAAYPGELSGGQRQRVAIARALAAEGELIICDEITSALDVSVQASILELLRTLRDELSLSLLFVSHDLSVVRSVADRVMVMHHGAIRESRDTEELFAAPHDPYTRALIDAAPRIADHVG